MVLEEDCMKRQRRLRVERVSSVCSDKTARSRYGDVAERSACKHREEVEGERERETDWTDDGEHDDAMCFCVYMCTGLLEADHGSVQGKVSATHNGAKHGGAWRVGRSLQDRRGGCAEKEDEVCLRRRYGMSSCAPLTWSRDLCLYMCDRVMSSVCVR